MPQISNEFLGKTLQSVRLLGKSKNIETATSDSVNEFKRCFEQGNLTKKSKLERIPQADEFIEMGFVGKPDNSDFFIENII